MTHTNIIDDLQLLEPPGPLPLWLQILMGAVAAGLLVYLIWRRRRQQRLALAPEVEAQQALEDALEELEKAHRQLSRENCRPYAICVSGIVRRYIERRFNIHAPRRSTEEFLAEARNAPELAPAHQEKLGQFLKCCDFLKFARGTAEVDELELLHQAAVIFVTETQFKPLTPAEQQARRAADANAPAATPAPNPEVRP
ncbi:MAG: hypothetical protein N3J91_15615 [Verrucomicrobiae bacterium]|nr:hypothetical protein [Verrucomicrobiae bacterium]